jgi:hypothetical protein
VVTVDLEALVFKQREKTMSGVDPYNAQGSPAHPGVAGKPFNDPSTGAKPPQASPEVAPGQKVDNPGTGTFSPEQQGNVNRSQPAGLGGSANYGELAPGDVNPQGVAGPVTNPVPEGGSPPQQDSMNMQDQVDDPEITPAEEEIADDEDA